MKALIIVDIQNDFVPGGVLPVSEGNMTVSVANSLVPYFEHVLGTQDWHPLNHGSFAANHPGKVPGEIIDLNGLKQILWPVHCVHNTWGAEFVPGLITGRFEKIFHKGTDPEIDSYSGFFDNGHRKSTGLSDYLEKSGIKEIYIMGLATDYCVKYSVLDALHLGLKVTVIADGCRGINLNPGDVEKAYDEMKNIGASIIQSSDIFGKWEVVNDSR
jgi:nicotinamidase/pyrazinamidase